MFTGKNVVQLYYYNKRGRIVMSKIPPQAVHSLEPDYWTVRATQLYVYMAGEIGKGNSSFPSEHVVSEDTKGENDER